jgi:uncharacterized protein YdeI (BOF family)
MKYYLTILLHLLFTANIFAQTGIGTTTPNASAKLDVYATNKGFLPPRVTLTSATDATTIASPAEGLLVYNLGSVGLQAGYYYWNGANWATIATASSAGNGVTSTDMVKLYGEVYSAASGKIGHANGYSFTVPVSGRSLFDFSSSGYLNQASMTITFKVRQGTTDLGTDFFTNANNNVHVVFEGKVEVNLQAGVTYNVNVSTTGSRDGGDYDRVFYKQVAGNLPVTGQSVDYVQASLSANQTLSSAGNIIFNVSSGAGITITSGGFNLIANKTYKLEGALGGTSGGYAYYAWVDNSNTILPGGSIGATMKAGNAYTDAPQDKAVVYYTPSTNSIVYLRVYSVNGGVTAYAPSTSTNYSSTWASIQQVGSSAFVNPWTLSGTNTFNTTGNVGIGTNSPTQALDVTGNVNVTGKINVTDPAGNVATKAAAFVARGVDVTLGNLKARIAATGNFSVQLSTVSGSYSVYGSHYLVDNGAYSNSIDGSSPLSITTTPTYIASGNNFLGAGNTSVWLLMDTTTKMCWRITMIVGAGYNNNFISIERLL